MNLRRLADHLEQAGLVQVIPDPEHSQRRVVRATSAGVAVSEQLAARAAALNRRLEQLLGHDDLAQLQDLLEKLQTILSDPGVAHQAQRMGSDRSNTYEGTE
jgi:DNA-binding MarR family transcriptional regulator